MRPVYLEVQAFGAFADKQVFDFRLLGTANLFLVCGPTGAGKTTMFDAMCMALYGDSSGGERKDTDMRSHHAKPHVQTHVRFEFAVSDRLYRAVLIPRQQLQVDGRARDIKTQALLYRLDHGNQPDDQARLLARNVREVRSHIVSLLGFECEQFRQVVMLAQGRFRRVLQADSRQREQILEQLFDTGIYKRMEEILKENTKNIAERSRKVREKIDDELQRLACDNEKALRMRRDETRKTVTDLELRIESARKHHHDLQSRLAEAKNAHDVAEQARQAAVELQQLLLAQDHHRDLSRVLKAAAGAHSLQGYDLGLQDKKTGFEALDAQANALRSCIQEAEQRLQRLEIQSQCEKTQLRLQELGDRIQTLRALQPNVQAWESCRAQLQTWQDRVGQEGSKLEHAQQRLRLLEQSQQDLNGKISDLQRQKEKGADLSLLLEKQAQLRQHREQLDQVLAQIDSAEKNNARQKSLLEQNLRLLRQAEGELAALQDDYDTAQAAVLSQTLEPGRPCPVCGSCEHPRPATHEGVSADKQPLTQKQAEIDALRARLALMEKQLASAGGELAAFNARREMLVQWLGTDGSMNSEQLRARWLQLQQQQQAHEECCREHDRLCQQQAQIQNDVGGCREQMAQWQQCLKEAQEETARWQGKLHTLEDMFAGYEPQKIAGLLESAAGEHQQAMAGQQRLREEIARLQQELAGWRAQSGLIQAQSRTMKETYRVEEREFHHRLAQAGFEDVKQLRRAYMAAEEREELERQIRQYEQNLATAQEKHHQLQARCETLVLTPLQPLMDEVAAAESQREKKQQLLGQLCSELSGLEQGLSRIKHLQRQVRGLDKQYQQMGELGRAANGDNAMGITFQRFVLGGILDQVLQAASQRLARMTHHRYLLKRAHQRPHRRGANFGLDLLLFDQFTGTQRDVRTLSGGESFLASLALALGLSDVVQGASGGCRLDTLFIDEGFGSLSPDALDQALMVLQQLSGHGRLIGIISHVPELKERIDIRLEVTSTRQGSHAEFVGM